MIKNLVSEDSGVSVPLLSIILPVFNEEQNIPLLVGRLTKLMEQTDLAAEVEVIFVDDHSTDHSPALLREIQEHREGFSYLRLSRNSGSHVAILAGLEHARGDCAVFLAADLQDPPELIRDMVELWRTGHHIVWAVREHHEGISWANKLISKLFHKLLKGFGNVCLPPPGSDFALLDRAVIQALLRSAGAHPSLNGEIAQLGFSQTQVSYRKAQRAFGRSKWNLERKLQAFADAFVSFSYFPLRLMSYLGMSCSMLGFLYALVVIILRIFSASPITGWSSIMVVVLVLGGIQMIMLGVLGEYLWRTMEEARRRPRYFLEDSCGGNGRPQEQGTMALVNQKHPQA